ncbi:unnamed protein product [Brassica oleracea]
MAAYFLNPYYFYKDPTIQYDIEVSEGFIKCVETFYHGEFVKQDLIHTKKRNILDVNRLNSLVYVQFNARPFDNQKKSREGNVDVILDDGNEDTVGDWLVGCVEEFDNDVSFVLTTQAPRIRELYDDDFESEEEDMMDMEFEPDVYQEDPVFRDSQIA